MQIARSGAHLTIQGEIESSYSMSTLAFSNEILSVVLSYLDARERFLTARAVDRQWYYSVMNDNEQRHIYIGLKKSNSLQKKVPGQCRSVQLFGKVIKQACDDPSNANGISITSMTNRKRTRGHLPEPGLDHFSGATVSIFLAEKYCNEGLCSVPVKEVQVLTLDLTDPFSMVYGRSLARSLKQLNISSLTLLKQLSIRGSCLTDLVLPLSLEALDASGCTHLKRILIPLIRPHQHDEQHISGSWRSINLNGCRALQIIRGPASNIDALAQNIQELDLSACGKLPSSFIAALLQSTHCLASLSLRYIATDAILEALGNSTGASKTLALCDVAFSGTLTDSSVMALVQRAKQLDRLNLRGCTNVSSYCYNTTPIRLQQRRDKQNGIDAVITDTATLPVATAAATRHASHALRKGDNVFYLASFSSSQGDRKPSAKRLKK